ncbi:MAG: hypothetical protein QGH99_08350 [Pseudomonadales bacterium]|jgi:hypothetical protein|nr:hypothetical protein [Gammaproteobacteria bacterium]MDP6027030.1 hypothetical protein [Pseudomonadales bacterium]MDP6317536.1 hypothetical protein [Pseudomonadales bacterium]MDP7314685.1 hypothetical protein [Pseudomonadales bacterium]MDP7576960.1 hypothetical protein [Pseudomonadales bacterium]|tara:strand:+ start:140 stop:319 length:180 start_codon:yes stop_codon:yes gene_type:complete
MLRINAVRPWAGRADHFAAAQPSKGRKSTEFRLQIHGGTGLIYDSGYQEKGNGSNCHNA